MPIPRYAAVRARTSVSCPICGCMIDSERTDKHANFHVKLDNIDNVIKQLTQSTLPPCDPMKGYENFLTVRVQYKGEFFVLARQFGEDGEVEFCNNRLVLNEHTIMEFDSISGERTV